MMIIDKLREVRTISGAGVADCKSALEEAQWNVELAIEILQKKGILKAAARVKREANCGLIRSYVHNDRIGVIVEVNCETDFVARLLGFQTFANEVAMQIAAMSPLWVSSDDIPKEYTDKQVEIFTEQVRLENKPEKSWPKIVEGKIKKWHSEVCLLNQTSVIHTDQVINDIMLKISQQTGESIKIRRFSRFEIETSSFNLTRSAEDRNAENCLIVHDQKLGEGKSNSPKETYAEEVARLANK